MMDLKLNDKVVIVTGDVKGIGLEKKYAIIIHFRLDIKFLVVL